MTNTDIDFPVSRTWAMWYDNNAEEDWATKEAQEPLLIVSKSELVGATFRMTFKVRIDDADGQRWALKARMRKKFEDACARIVATPQHQPIFMQRGASQAFLTIEVKAEVYFL